MIQPIAESSAVEVLLVTPQMQSEEAGLRAQEQGLVGISEKTFLTGTMSIHSGKSAAWRCMGMRWSSGG